MSFNSGNKKTIGIIFGGQSPEYEVSCDSAAAVISNTDPEKYNLCNIGITPDGKWFIYKGGIDKIRDLSWETDKENLVPAIVSPCSAHHGVLALDKETKTYNLIHIDCIFPVMHGETGEDGVMQGLLRLSGIPYVGCETCSAAVCMDKSITKIILEKYGIRQADWMLIYRRDFFDDEKAALDFIEEKFSYPVFVKPANTGSSVGVNKACDRTELASAIRIAAKYDEKIIIEEEICGRELEISVLEGYIGTTREVLTTVPGEIISGGEFYDYDSKYKSNASKVIVPAEVDEETCFNMRTLAKRIFLALSCRGFARCDFFLRDKEIIFNEINAIPGFTKISMYPKLWEHMGTSFASLCDKLIEFALKNEEK